MLFDMAADAATAPLICPLPEACHSKKIEDLALIAVETGVYLRFNPPE